VEPLFPFGYGLSYTSFRYEFLDFKCNWDFVEIDIHVMNIGKKAGRDVVQVYVTAPNGRLPKPYQELRAYTKTSLINPGQSERIKLIFKTESMASYDESQAAYVMEQGNYNVRLGRHSRDTDIIQIINLDRETIVRQLRNLLKPDRAINLLISAKCEVVDSAWDTSENDNANKILMGKHKPAAGSTLLDVAAGLVSIERFVSSLEVDVLLRLVTGHANETSYKTVNRMKKKTKRVSGPSSSGATTSLFVKPLGIPNWLLTDGPAGLHLPLCGATCYPVGMVIAQTWDDQAGIRMGSGVGLELKYYNHSVILGPGLNIHRDPLCGRNFEYFSEDPLISGKTAAAVTKGVQSIPGTSVSIKHFACNNQEENRYTTNSTVSERALREIYLKGFEICVRESNPNTVMTSYNKINGVHASSNYELLTEVLRGEWGFEGLVMTDWGTRSNKALDLHAGNDLIMGGYRSDYLKAAMEGRSPEFAPDGYVRSESFKVYGGFMTENVEYWNVFEPDSNGSDTVSTIVQPDDIATVYVNSDGSKTVTYRGRNRGAYLPLEDVQVCAVRVLTQIMNSVSYEVMMNRFK
jgi:beta-glucosidase